LDFLTSKLATGGPSGTIPNRLRRRYPGRFVSREQEDADGALEALATFHARVDRRADALAADHAERLHCGRGCAACCVDDITVFEVEAERIRRAHDALLRSEAPHPPGACAFLDARGSCRIYADRPYVCRTQGLPLRWHEEGSGEQVVEYRDICPLNLEGKPLEALPEEECWLLGPNEAELARIAERMCGEPQRRIPLRALFTSDDQS